MLTGLATSLSLKRRRKSLARTNLLPSEMSRADECFTRWIRYTIRPIHTLYCSRNYSVVGRNMEGSGDCNGVVKVYVDVYVNFNDPETETASSVDMVKVTGFERSGSTGWAKLSDTTLHFCL